MCANDGYLKQSNMMISFPRVFIFLLNSFHARERNGSQEYFYFDFTEPLTMSRVNTHYSKKIFSFPNSRILLVFSFMSQQYHLYMCAHCPVSEENSQRIFIFFPNFHSSGTSNKFFSHHSRNFINKVYY